MLALFTSENWFLTYRYEKELRVCGHKVLRIMSGKVNEGLILS